MRPEPGQSQLDARIAASSVEERVAWVAARRTLGIQLVWRQVDAAGITHPVEQAEFMLRRLYPEMPRPWFDATIAALAERHAQGSWHGFRRD